MTKMSQNAQKHTEIQAHTVHALTHAQEFASGKMDMDKKKKKEKKKRKVDKTSTTEGGDVWLQMSAKH